MPTIQQSSVRRNDHTGALVKLTHQMKNKAPPTSLKRQIPHLIVNDQIRMHQPGDRLSRFARLLFMLQSIHHLDRREERNSSMQPFESLNPDRGGQVRLPVPGA